MPESLIGLGLVVLFCVIGLAVNADAEVLIFAGLALAAIGFAYGIPTAIVYHWRLHRALDRAGRLPPRWWLQPTAHHHLLPRDERAGVLLWALIGGSGFGVIVLGIVLTSVGLWRTLSS
ncbi:MAG: hypothetical protein H6748_08945 [Spirochaetaceae bacterium]|nr:hypothetical protein [Myxococcales bacterium]MCB9724157.1 hypothetical protein [Spirochaetaceae bacterium]HPG28200.1 hypothetical protein [Myxococcota bacterium]